MHELTRKGENPLEVVGNDFERVLNHFEGIENDLEQAKNHFEQVCCAGESSAPVFPCFGLALVGLFR